MQKHAASLAIVLLVASAVPGAGQSQTDIDGTTVSKISPGQVFQPFTVWEQLRLGATTLVNPKTAQEAAVVYAYDTNVLKTADFLNTNFVFAKQTGSNQYAAVDTATTAAIIEKLKTSGMTFEDGLKVLSYQKIPQSAAAENLMIGWAQ